MPFPRPNLQITKREPPAKISLIPRPLRSNDVICGICHVGGMIEPLFGIQPLTPNSTLCNHAFHPMCIFQYWISSFNHSSTEDGQSWKKIFAKQLALVQTFEDLNRICVNPMWWTQIIKCPACRTPFNLLQQNQIFNPGRDAILNYLALRIENKRAELRRQLRNFQMIDELLHPEGQHSVYNSCWIPRCSICNSSYQNLLYPISNCERCGKVVCFYACIRFVTLGVKYLRFSNGIGYRALQANGVRTAKSRFSNSHFCSICFDDICGALDQKGHRLLNSTPVYEYIFLTNITQISSYILDV